MRLVPFKINYYCSNNVRIDGHTVSLKHNTYIGLRLFNHEGSMRKKNKNKQRTENTKLNLKELKETEQYHIDR